MPLGVGLINFYIGVNFFRYSYFCLLELQVIQGKYKKILAQKFFAMGNGFNINSTLYV